MQFLHSQLWNISKDTGSDGKRLDLDYKIIKYFLKSTVCADGNIAEN